MEKDDKGTTMIRMGVSGWMFLLVPAYPGCPGWKAVKRSLLLFCCFSCDIYRAVLVACNLELTVKHSTYKCWQLKKTSFGSIGLYIMAVADFLETRISTRARKGQESQNYLKHDCCRQKNDIPIKDDTVAENWAKNYKGNRLHSLQSTHVWSGNGQS